MFKWFRELECLLAFSCNNRIFALLGSLLNTDCGFHIVAQHRYSSNSNHAEVNLVTAFVPSETACFASSPGRMSLTAV